MPKLSPIETIRIPPGIKVSEIGRYYELLYANKNANLHLPKRFTKNQMGLSAGLLQFAITWVRIGGKGCLLLDVDDPQKTNFNVLYENELLFPVVCFVWNRKAIYNKSGLIDLRTSLKVPNTYIFDQMREAKALKGDKLILINFDHLPGNRGILPCFEVNHKFVSNESVLLRNLMPGLSSVLKLSKKIEKQFNIKRAGIIGIIFELMSNTFEWARHDTGFVKLDPSMRGLMIRFFKRQRAHLIADLSGHNGLRRYLESQVHKENELSQIYFCEITVFDSGCGLVDRFRADNNISGKNDVEIVKKCLSKHATSAKGIEGQIKGLGLDRTLKTLDNRGFLSIRTAEVHVYRNLIRDRYVPTQRIQDIILCDWQTDSQSEFSSYPRAEGTLVTIILPLAVSSDSHE